MSSSRIITLMTDFGTSDTYVAQMKGVILGICHNVHIVDLTHQIAPQDVLHAMLNLESATDAFPDDTLHLIVVDPGVGSERRIVAVSTDNQRFVCPDNGILTGILQRSTDVSAVSVTRTDVMRTPVSDVFHGRDIMAPAAAHWAAGADLLSLGEPLDPDELIRIAVPEPVPVTTPDGRSGLQSRILRIDHFGNAITGIPRRSTDVSGHVVVPGIESDIPVVTHYAAGRGRPLVALFGSGGFLELAVADGSAAKSWNLHCGLSVEWYPAPGSGNDSEDP